MIVTREQVLRMLEKHGLTPDEPTAVDTRNDQWIEYSSFDHEIGKRDYYELEDIKRWLGY